MQTEYCVYISKNRLKYFVEFEKARKFARRNNAELYRDKIVNGIIVDTAKLYSPDEDE